MKKEIKLWLENAVDKVYYFLAGCSEWTVLGIGFSLGVLFVITVVRLIS
jgi:hypothetical protein